MTTPCTGSVTAGGCASRSASCTTTATCPSTRCWSVSSPTTKPGGDRHGTDSCSNATTASPSTGAPSTATSSVSPDRAGIARVHPHQLRHTLATQCLNRGMSLEAIAALLGHRSPSMTLIYARISDENVAEQYFNATQAVEAEATAASRRRQRPRLGRAPPAAGQRTLHPTGRAGLPLPDHLRRLRVLRDRRRVRRHPAPPARRRHRSRRRPPDQALRRAGRSHRRQRLKPHTHERRHRARGRSAPGACASRRPAAAHTSTRRSSCCDAASDTACAPPER